MYITFKEEEPTTLLFKRASEIRNNEIRITNYIAPQFYERYSSLQMKCKEERKQNKQLRTKVMLGEKDLVLKTKLVGEAGYKVQPIDCLGPLPDFDHSIVWPITNEMFCRMHNANWYHSSN